MEYSSQKEGAQTSIMMEGKFSFSDHAVFKTMLDDIIEEGTELLVLDLQGVEFIDSSALGLLLLLRDEADKKNVGLILKSPGGQVKKMFEISRFYDLFTIHQE